MNKEYTATINLQSNSQKESTGTVIVKELSINERVQKTVFSTLMALLVTIMAIAIPILHFILVPLGLILSAFVCVRSFNKTKVILSGTGSCPECSKEFNISKRPYGFPFFDVCEHCRREIKVDL